MGMYGLSKLSEVFDGKVPKLGGSMQSVRDIPPAVSIRSPENSVLRRSANLKMKGNDIEGKVFGKFKSSSPKFSMLMRTKTSNSIEPWHKLGLGGRRDVWSRNMETADQPRYGATDEEIKNFQQKASSKEEFDKMYKEYTGEASTQKKGIFERVAGVRTAAEEAVFGKEGAAHREVLRQQERMDKEKAAREYRQAQLRAKTEAVVARGAALQNVAKDLATSGTYWELEKKKADAYRAKGIPVEIISGQAVPGQLAAVGRSSGRGEKLDYNSMRFSDVPALQQQMLRQPSGWDVLSAALPGRSAEDNMRKVLIGSSVGGDFNRLRFAANVGGGDWNSIAVASRMPQGGSDYRSKVISMVGSQRDKEALGLVAQPNPLGSRAPPVYGGMPQQPLQPVQPVQYQQEQVYEEPVQQARPAAGGRGPRPGPEYQWSPLSKKWVRYPRGPYNKHNA